MADGVNAITVLGSLAAYWLATASKTENWLQKFEIRGPCDCRRHGKLRSDWM